MLPGWSASRALRARKFLKDWASVGFLTEEQYQRMEQETVCDLRRTNIFLRLVLFLFTLVIVGAAIGLFFAVFLSRPSEQTTGVVLLIFAVISYAAAEFTVSRARLYRHGVEEALAAASVGFLCFGLQFTIFSGRLYSTRPGNPEILVAAAGAIFSLWIWRRFGPPDAFAAAMIFVLFLPGCWTSSQSAKHLIVAVFYAAGLIVVAAARSRHRFDYVDDGYSLVEAFLWLGICLALNLQLSSLDLLREWWGGAHAGAEFSRPFYWTTGC